MNIHSTSGLVNYACYSLLNASIIVVIIFYKNDIDEIIMQVNQLIAISHPRQYTTSNEFNCCTWDVKCVLTVLIPVRILRPTFFTK